MGKRWEKVMIYAEDRLVCEITIGEELPERWSQLASSMKSERISPNETII
jgi:hypothetical protein